MSVETWMPDETWTVARLLLDQVAKAGDAPFCSVDGGPWRSFAELEASARDWAARLATLGVSSGDVVPTMLPTSFESLGAWFGVNLLGSADMPLNPAFRGVPLEHALRLSRSTVAVVHASLIDQVMEAAAVVPTLEHLLVVGGPARAGCPLQMSAFADVAPATVNSTGGDYRAASSVLLTSGTTGPSKGVIMSNAQVCASAHQIMDLVGAGPDDVFYSAHPLFHMAGKLGVVLGALSVGARVALVPSFDAAHWLEDIRKVGATVTIGHGPLLEMIQQQPEKPDDDDNPLRAVIAGGLPVTLAEPFERRFGVRCADTYGMSELNVIASTPVSAERRPGAAGPVNRALYNVMIADPATDEPLPAGTAGEILVRPLVPWLTTLGYLGMPEKTIEAWRNLWFHTGDIAIIDEDDYLHFVERTGDRIRRRAENISAFDIEVAVLAFEGVLECAAVGVPSEFDADDDVKACVVPRLGSTVDPLDLLRHCALQLPHYMVPRYIEILDELPRTPTKKVQKGALRAAGVSETTWDRRAAGVDLRALIESTRDA